MIRRISALLLALLLLLSGCANKPEPSASQEKPKLSVGICMPDFSWNTYATQLNQLLKASGYQVMVEYAGGDVQTQNSQVQTFVSMPVDCLVVVAVDSMALGDALAYAKQDGVPVIALDRMLMYTDAVTGCVAMDYYAAGKQIGQHIVEKEQLETAVEPVTIEFYMGATENHSALRFYQGVMEQLQPYFDKGVLLCRSGRTAFEDTCIQQETSQAVYQRCLDQLWEHYKKAAPDVVCAATDALAEGCISALTRFGLKPEKENWPLVTGAGATEQGMNNVALGYQSVTLRADMQLLVTQCVLWVQAAVKGKELTADTFFNGVTDVPTWLLTPTILE